MNEFMRLIQILHVDHYNVNLTILCYKTEMRK